MNDGVWSPLFEDTPNRDKISDVDFPVRAMDIVAGSTKLTHEPSSHEAGRAGDKDLHGRKLPDCRSKGNDHLHPNAT
jgi:hypothetical protein